MENKNELSLWVNTQWRQDELTRVNVKLSTVVGSCVKVKEAVLASHDPDEFIRLGLRFTNDWMV